MKHTLRFSVTLRWLIVVISGGCQSTVPQMESRPVIPVDGQVLVAGKAYQGIVVTFFSDDPTQEGKPQGITDSDGRFRLETYRAKGAPGGSYSVSVFWPSIPKKVDDAQIPGDRLGRRYADPKSSGLRAVVEGVSTTLPPFQLK